MDPRGPESSDSPKFRSLFAYLFLVIAVVAVHSNGIYAIFVFDDHPGIELNESIQSWYTAFSPASGKGQTVEGRPLLNLTFCLNYQISQYETWSYHIFNIAVHAVNTCLLFWLIYNIAYRWSKIELVSQHAFWMAFLIALIWSVHPINTKCVVYISQRAESLASMFYMLSIVAFVNSINTLHKNVWRFSVLISFAIGIFAKEILMTLPICLLLLDRTFVANSWMQILKERVWFYTSFLLGYVLLVYLMLESGDRGDTIGFAGEVTAFDYLCTQAWGITRYLRLCLYPTPLIFDYGTQIYSFAEVWIPFFILGVLFLVASYAVFIQNSEIGFLGFLFFLLLAPSSSLIPVNSETISEHRMYLASAVILILLFTFLLTVIKNFSNLDFSDPIFGLILILIAIAVAIAFSITTVKRNQDFASAESIWRDTAIKRPKNDRAHQNLGIALMLKGDNQRSYRALSNAIEVNPNNPFVHNLRAFVALRLNNPKRAIRDATFAINMKNVSNEYSGMRYDYFNNRGEAYMMAGNFDSAQADFESSLKEKPENEKALFRLGLLYEKQENYEKSHDFFNRLLKINIKPDRLFHRGLASLKLKNYLDAISDFTESLAMHPKNAYAIIGRIEANMAINNKQEALKDLNLLKKMGLNINPAMLRKIGMDLESTGIN